MASTTQLIVWTSQLAGARKATTLVRHDPITPLATNHAANKLAETCNTSCDTNTKCKELTIEVIGPAAERHRPSAEQHWPSAERLSSIGRAAEQHQPGG